MTELQRLDELVDAFAAAMKEKLHLKYDEGFEGWEDCNPVDWRQSVEGHVPKGDPIDVANFAAFWWNSLGRPKRRP